MSSPSSPHEEPEFAELPSRPRRRLLAPAPLALLAVLLIACGFIAGVLVQKGQTSPSSSRSPAASIASRFAPLRGGGRRGGAGAAGAPAASGSPAGAGATAGQVAYIAGSTLYVINAEGNTVKVATSTATSVTKAVQATVKGIHPGETVTVSGASAKNGSIAAESIRVVNGAGGGLATLFGGPGSGSGSGSAPSAASGAASGGSALFGNGG